MQEGLENRAIKRAESKKRSRLRRRGPYRKSVLAQRRKRKAK